MWTLRPDGGVCVLQVIKGVNLDAAEKQLLFTANWFEHPHPNGRNLRGEADFASIRLIHALFGCYDRLNDEIRAALENFYLRRDYSSIYGSENHALMYRVSRCLAAQFYHDRMFEQYGKTAETVLKEDEAYIDEFLMYRAKRAWGEFDSMGYGAEIMLILNTLYMYTKNAVLKKKAAMMMDMILLDMVVDTKNALYGGAHGRIYPPSALNSEVSGLYGYYCYYFGAEGGHHEAQMSVAAALLSDYIPDEIIYRVAKNRTYPYENRERKHLHCCEAWAGEINRDILREVEGYSIDKYLYLSDKYMLGSVIRQDKYPDTIPCGHYAHHQQHEWELTFPDTGDGRAKIFSHHPGNEAYHSQHQHNLWTGDIGCNCGTHFCSKDTAISLYNITGEHEFRRIHAYIPTQFFEEMKTEENFIFLRHHALYIMVWFSSPYHMVTEGETAGYETVSEGDKHAFVCHVADGVDFETLDAFAAAMKAQPPVFDREKMTADFCGVHLDCASGSIDGEIPEHPYSMLYDSPYLKSVYGSGILQITDGYDSVVYDFNF